MISFPKQSLFMRYSHLRILIFAITSSFFLFSQAAISEEAPKSEQGTKLYRIVDKNGNVSYSDQPSPGAKEVIIKDAPSINIKKTKVDFEALEEQLEAQREASDDYYSVINFLNLKEDGVIRNNGSSVTLTANLSPGLSKGHLIKFYIDGNLIGEAQKELTITAQEIEYGSHTASFVVVSKNGVKIQDSETVNFNLLHILRKKTGSTNGAGANNILSPGLPVNANLPSLPTPPKLPTYDSMKKTDT